MGRVERRLLAEIKRYGSIHLTLIDPEKEDPRSASEKAVGSERGGTTAVMVGGSTATSSSHIDKIVRAIKKRSSVPVILFPSNVTGISKYADATWFMSLLNSSNQYFITGAQALGAPLVKKYKIEPISLGYLIVGSGGTVAIIGQANPIPYNHPEIAVIYALAAQYLGMHFVYLEAGSGAKRPVPSEMIQLVRRNISIPLIVGGGLRSAESVRRAVEAGADIVVTGTVVENSSSVETKIRELVQSIRDIRRN
jgi:phosphoglycerol geranylgeranyltransferase